MWGMIPKFASSRVLHCWVTTLERKVKFRWRRPSMYSWFYSTTLCGEGRQEGHDMYEVSLFLSLFSSIGISLIDINDNCWLSSISKRSTCMRSPIYMLWRNEINQNVSPGMHIISLLFTTKGESQTIEHNSF